MAKASENGKPSEPPKRDVLAVLSELEDFTDEELQQTLGPLEEQKRAIDRKIRRIQGTIKMRQMRRNRKTPEELARAKVELAQRVFDRIKAQPASLAALAKDFAAPETRINAILNKYSQTFRLSSDGRQWTLFTDAPRPR
jgi:hypothetical protein